MCVEIYSIKRLLDVFRYLRALLPVVFVVSAPAALGDGAIFRDAAAGGGLGLDFERQRSPYFSAVEAARSLSLVSPLAFEDLGSFPNMIAANGMPGLAVWDYDRDGDFDLYVSNGSGAANSLFQNQLENTGELAFIDVAVAAGAALEAQNSAGVCFGDVDNDNDPDLLVLGRGDANVLLENLGDGSFAPVESSGLAGDGYPSSGCSFGDIDGDGLLDVAIANNFEDETFLPIFGEPFALNYPNQLYRNEGRRTFADVSDASGFRSLVGLPPGVNTITWAIAMVDIDEDGDVDIVQADDQGAILAAKYGGVDRGYLHVFVNDGSGSFVDRPMIHGPESAGAWMALGFGDVNCDGSLDVLGSNFGDYNTAVASLPYALGDQATRLMLGGGDGSFSDAGVGPVGSSVFGWGNAVFDFDNDGDSDLLYHGGMDSGFMIFCDNPGVLIENIGCGSGFVMREGAFEIDHQARGVLGTAIGDLDGNGFVDIVTAANVRISDQLPRVPSGPLYASPLDASAAFVPTFLPESQGFVWSGVDHALGDLALELNVGNSNRWVSVRALGTRGLTRGGAVNRDGIGAVVSFQPWDGRTVKAPVQGGSSFISQHSLELGFGLGTAHHGRLEVLWPGGVRNRLYAVRHGSRVLLPEIPCSFDGPWPSSHAYGACVRGALAELEVAEVIDSRQRLHLYLSALVAYFEHHFGGR